MAVTNTHLTVKGITLHSSPFWTFSLRGGANVRIDDVKVGAFFLHWHSFAQILQNCAVCQ